MKKISIALLLISLLLQSVILAQKTDEELLGEVQSAYAKYSTALIMGEFKTAYDCLSSSQKKTTNYKLFVEANEKMSKVTNLKASQLSSLKMKGKYAAAKAVIYLDFIPEDKDKQVLNGKIETPVYFIKENGEWKIATGEEENMKIFLKQHPDAAKLMEPFKTQVYYKQKGIWIGFKYKQKEGSEYVIPQT
ncbi:MAG: hypothetical protein JW737_00120 [Acidobacteria bacterium]|nr:hypothetical protein [Acidobacteriota bacterium]